MKPCTRCGKCCTNIEFMGNLSATEEDVRRWDDQGRWDIMRYVSVLPPLPPWFPKGTGAAFPYADLWVDTENNDDEKLRCPFVRKDRNQNTYRCTIYEIRPQVCRDYVPFSGKRNDICEEVQPPKVKK
jgi:Fe-S-cluster containining protein